jgi:hypothetical protein
MPEAPPVSPPSPPARRTSLAARLLNIFATPGEVFEEVKSARPATANWLVPLLLYGLVAAVSSVMIVSQPAMIQQIRERQEKFFDEQVKSGAKTREQADREMEVAEKYSIPAAKIGAGISGFFLSFVTVFWWAFVLWLIGRWALKAPVGFRKTLEVAGLASAISVLEAVVRMLLVFGLSNPLASPSLALLIKNPDPHNPLYMLLSLTNVLTFWVLIVRAIGLAKLSGAPVLKVALWVFTAWAIVMMLGMGAGQAAAKISGG